MIAMLWGAGFGISAVALVIGLHPSTVSLAEAQRRIAPTAAAVTTVAYGARFSRPAVRALSRLGLPSRKLRSELELAGIDAEAFLTRKIRNALIGLLMPTVAQLALVEVKLAVPAVVVLGVGLAFAAVFFMAPDSEVYCAAQRMRGQTRESLDLLLSFTATSMLAGDGIESALDGAAAIGDGAAFERFRDAADAARTSRRPVWACYGELAERLGVAELGELAATVSLAGGEGAKIADSLAAKASSLRGRRNAERAAANINATERMYAPVAVMLLGFLMLLVFPSFSGFLTKF